MLVASLYSILLVRFRKDDIATLKCIGWDNAHIRILLIGEVFFVTMTAFVILMEIMWHILGIYFYIFAIDYGTITGIVSNEIILWWRKPILNQLISLGIIAAAQIPGLLIATFGVTRMSPMAALRKEE